MDTAIFIVHMKLEHVYEDLSEEVVGNGSIWGTYQKIPIVTKKPGKFYRNF